MGKKNKSSSKADKPKYSYQEKLKIDDIVKDILSKSSQIVPFTKAEEWDNYTSIYNLLQELQTLQNGSAAIPSDICRLERLKVLQEWVVKNGANIGGFEPAAFDSMGVGLKCTQSMAEGEMVMEIPRSVMMTVESALASAPLGSLLARDKMTRVMPQLSLTLHVLEEALNPDSHWAPYLRALPTAYTTVVYFTPQEMQLLKGSHVFEEAVKQCRNIARQYAYFHNFLNNTSSLMNICPEARSLRLVNNFTYEGYRWAASTVMTRMNNIPTDADCAEEALPGLIPFWDLANHANGIVSTDYCSEKGSSICYASRDFAADEQFFIFYGVRPNCEFLLHNGFVYGDNEHDAAAVRLGVSRSDPLYARRAALLERLNVPSSGVFYLHREGAPVDSLLMAFLRVFNMDEESLARWQRADNVADLGADTCATLPADTCAAVPADTCAAVPAEVERAAWRYLQTRLSLLLRLFTSAETDDLARLAGGAGSLVESMVVTLRVGERRILQRALMYAQHMIDV